MGKSHMPFRLFILLIALMLALAPAALADSFQAVVAVDSMNVYAEAAPHALLGALPRGTEVTVVSWSGETAKITYKKKTGLARVSDMRRVETETVTPMVANRDTRLYSKPSTSSAYADVKAGTTVQVLSVDGDRAKVSYGGKTGYMIYSHLSAPGTVETTPEQEPVKTGNVPVVTTKAARVYENADYTGGSVALAKGTKLTLLATRGDVAMVEKNGAIGYMSASCLKKDTSGGSGSTTGGNPFATGSNEREIYAFLTGEMGYNRAAAMGVMANIKYESSYRTDCVGDGGTSYGLCQWHAGRKTNLINWCAENGLDYTALDGQLRYLKYEVVNRYPSVHSYMKQVENSAEGAYDAAYYFCFNFEAPAARTSQSTKRGIYARDTLYGMK